MVHAVQIASSAQRETAMKWLDGIIENRSRDVARLSSRRGFLGALGAVVAGAGAVPLLPVARASTSAVDDVPAQATGHPPRTRVIRPPASTGATAASTVSCAAVAAARRTPARPARKCRPSPGSAPAATPPTAGTTSSPTTTAAARAVRPRCLCNRNEDDKPVYRPQANNDINWCMGTQSTATTAPQP